MKIIQRFLAFVALSVFLWHVALLAAAQAAEKGAVRLGANALYQEGAIVCGRISGRWRAGTLSKRYFISHADKIKNLAALASRSSGNKKNKIKRQISAFKAKQRSEKSTCNALPRSTKAVRFNLSNAQGLAMYNPQSLNQVEVQPFGSRPRGLANQSNLKKVDLDGKITEAIMVGNVPVKKLLIAPGNKTYLVFQQKVILNGGSSGAGCILAELQTDAQFPMCVDNDFDAVNWYGGAAGPSVQFDNSGAIYYSGYKGSRSVLRKYYNGVRSDLLNDYISVRRFLAMPDGSVYIAGDNTGGGAWFRRLTAGGSLQNIIAGVNQAPLWLMIFPDTKLYFGMWEPPYMGVFSMLANGITLDERAWMAHSDMGGTYGSENPHWDCSNLGSLGSFCGAMPSYMYRSPGGKVYMLDNKKLAMIYPEVQSLPSSVTSISVAKGLGSRLVLAGVDGQNRNQLIIYDPSNQTEIDLLNGQDIEAYRLNYLASEQKILFDGLRFVDNKYVIGQVNIHNPQVHLVVSGDSKFEDFQTFD